MDKKVLISIGVVLMLLATVFFAFRYLGPSHGGSAALRIGVIASLTGSGAPYGKNSWQGVQLAVEEVSESGGIAGKRVEVILEDDATDTKQAVSAFEKLAGTPGVQLVIGPASSGGVMACAPIANRKQIVILSPGAASPNITEAGDFVFRNRASGTLEAIETARFALRTLGVRTCAIMRIQTDYGVGFADSFRGEFDAGGGRVLGTEVFQQGATDMRAQIVRLKEVDPEAVYLVGVPGEASRALVQMRELGFRPKILTNNMESPDLLKNAGDAAEGIYFAIPRFDPKSSDRRIQEFAARYRKRFGANPDMFAADGYDAVFLAKEAIETHGTSGAQIRDGLYAIAGFPGVYGTISFDKNGDVVKPLAIRTVRNGRFADAK